MSKHTPGPWRVVPAINKADHFTAEDEREYRECMQEARVLYSDSDPHDASYFVADVFLRLGEPAGTNDPQANARLIASAPELLDALREIATGDPALDVFAIARTVIRKATGE